MWKFIRLICWPLCPILLAAYTMKLAALLAEAPDNPRLNWRWPVSLRELFYTTWPERFFPS
jgi:hypothetical protein